MARRGRGRGRGRGRAGACLAAAAGLAGLAGGALAAGGGPVPDALEGLAAQLREAFADGGHDTAEESIMNLAGLISENLEAARRGDGPKESTGVRSEARARARAVNEPGDDVEEAGTERELKGAWHTDETEPSPGTGVVDVPEGGAAGFMRDMAEELQREFGLASADADVDAKAEEHPSPLELLREGLQRELARGEAARQKACEGDTCDVPDPGRAKESAKPRRPARLTEKQLAEAREILTGNPALAELGAGIKEAEARLAEVKAELERLQAEGRTPEEMQGWLDAQGLRGAAVRPSAA